MLFLTGHDNVKANGLPVVRDGSECTINCNAAGVGGAKGYVHTNTESVNSEPREASEPLSVAEQLQQEAQANLERVGELRDAVNDNPNGKTAAQAQALRAQLEELSQAVEHQQQAMMEASRNGTLTDDELHDLMDYINETTVSVVDLQDNAGRQVARGNVRGTWVDVLIGFNPVIAGAQLLEGVGDGIRSGQYGQAMLPVLLDATPIGRSLGSMVNKVFGGFKKPKKVDRDSSSSTNDTSANQRESGQDNEGLRVEQTIPPRVQSRINLSNEGVEHTLRRHLNPARAGNKSQFSLSESELRALLGAESAIQAPVKVLETGNFARTITTNRTVGSLAESMGGGSTNTFVVVTDRFGNLKTAFPGGV